MSAQPKNVAAMLAEAAKPHSFQREVWQTLSRIDCSKHVEKKMGLSYLPWAWAWAVLMEAYPESEFAFDGPVTYPDGTQEVWVTVTVRDGERSSIRRMWLPVLDHQNRPVKAPNAFQINNSRMRCLTKGLAMHGLGHHIYAGEDVPRPELDVNAVGDVPATITDKQAEELKQLLAETNSDTLAFLKAMGGAASVDELPAAAYERALSALNKKLAKQRAGNAA
jgi:hypothetical protein